MSPKKPLGFSFKSLKMSDDCNMKPIVERLLSELKFVHEHSQNYPTDWETLKQLALELSSYLPRVSDSTIFAIDDLVHGDDNDVVAGTRVVPEILIRFLVVNSYEVFHCAIFKQGIFNREVEMVFLQLLGLLPEYYFSGPEFEGTLKTLLSYDRNEKIERQLKVLKVAVENHRHAIVFQINESYDHKRCTLRISDLHDIVATLWMLSLTDESDYEHPNKRRWASWVSQLSMSILEKLLFSQEALRFPLFEYIGTFKRQKEDLYNGELVCVAFYSCLRHAVDLSMKSVFGYEPLLTNLLFKYFTTARDDAQKLQRIHSFVEGFHDFKSAGSESTEYCFRDHSPEEMERAVQTFVHYLNFITYDILNLFRVFKCYPSIKLMKLVSRYGHDGWSQSYLPKGITCSSYLTFKEETVELMDKYFGNANHFEVLETSEEPFEKDEMHKFMKNLQILDIFYTTWIMLEDDINLQNIKGLFVPRFINGLFRRHAFDRYSPIKCSLKEFVMNPEKRGRIHFLLQVVLRKCPFLILTHHDGISHMENLIKMMSGRNIGKAAEEALYYRIKECEVY